MTCFLLFCGLLHVSARADPLLHDCTHLAYKWGFITEFNSSKWVWDQRWLLLYGMVSSTECDVLVWVGEFMVWASCGNTIFRRKMILCILVALNKKKALLNSAYVIGLNLWYLNEAFKTPDIWSSDACHGEHSACRVDSSGDLSRSKESCRKVKSNFWIHQGSLMALQV